MRRFKTLTIKDYWCSDIPFIWAYQAVDDCIFYELYFVIGFIEEIGGDIFNITIASPEGLKMNKPLIKGKKLLVITDYSWQTVKQKLNALLDRVKVNACSHWLDTQTQLAIYFDWEYAGYV